MTDAESGDITTLLRRWTEGDSGAEEALFRALHLELRRVAGRALRRERSDHTLQPTELVSEVYLRIAPDAADWQDRAHFLAVAARAMRRVLIDHARARKSDKRGGRAAHVTLDGEAVQGGLVPVDVERLDVAMLKLQALDERKAKLVELRYFGGLSIAETAHVTGWSERTVKRELQLGRAWLRREIHEG